MSAYPNFWVPQQTTNQYQNAGQPMQNPYIDRMNQMQQHQQNMQMNQPQFQMQSPQPPGINGRVVNDFSEITASDVPMNEIGRRRDSGTGMVSKRHNPDSDLSPRI